LEGEDEAGGAKVMPAEVWGEREARCVEGMREGRGEERIRVAVG
jgi:hypothetical protein